MITVEREIICDVKKWSRGYRGTYYDPPEPPEPEDYNFLWADTNEELSKAELEFFEKECDNALNEAELPTKEDW